MQTSSENVKSRLIAIAAFAAVCWVLAVAVYAFMATGRIFCANPVKYAGRITPDENGKITFTEEFILNNRGFRDIEIQTVESSCGCTKIVYPNKIPKFSSAKIVAITLPAIPVSSISVQYIPATLRQKQLCFGLQTKLKTRLPQILKANRSI